MKRIEFVTNEYYHIFNRGVDKRKIFLDSNDMKRFFQSMEEFNAVEPINSIYENSFHKALGGSTSKQIKLVNFICYCLNPNHFHFILEPLIEKGVEKFMQRLGTGYTMYFNEKYKRSGALFQGRYKATYINAENLLYVSVYVNLNDKVHKLGGSTSKSSWNEYMSNQKQKTDFCVQNIILEQFKNITEYKEYAAETIKIIQEKKIDKNEDLEVEPPSDYLSAASIKD
ncbi:MAG: transposase [Candidatus Niyogibacteria bacterium]|nr:transposase [Candidatus Niyogibacteria bacterium]